MTRLLFALLLCCAQLARADVTAVPAQCDTPSTYWFQEILITVVQSNTRTLYVTNTQPQPQVIIHQCFSSHATCTDARLKLNAFGFDVVLGSGLSALAYIGRSTTECVQR
jgi:hypothetical protein